MRGAGQAKTLENGRGVRFGGVSVLALIFVLEHGEAFGVEFNFGVGQQLLSFGHHVPQIGIPHERDVDNLLLFEEKLVLAQHALQRRRCGMDRLPSLASVAGQDI